MLATDLAQLKKLRQECIQLREYNEALNKIIVIKREEQEKMCLQRARRKRRDSLHKRLLLGEAALTMRRQRGMLLAWRRQTQRSRSMLLAFEQESDTFWRARWMRRWQLILLEKKVRLSIDFCQDKKCLAEGMQDKFNEAERRLKKARTQQTTQRLNVLMFALAQLESDRFLQIFMRWADYASSMCSHRVQVQLLLFPNKSLLLQDCLNAWKSALRFSQKPRMTFSLAHSRCEQVVSNTAARLLIFLNAWRHEAGFTEKMQATVTFKRNFPLRMALLCFEHRRRVRLADSLRTWRHFAFEDSHEEGQRRVRHKCHTQEIVASRRQIADTKWSCTSEAAWNWNVLRKALSNWIWSSMSSSLSARRESVQQVHRLRSSLDAAQGKQRSDKVAIGVLAFSLCLARFCRRKKYSAFKHWRWQQASNGIFGQLEASQDSAALLSFKRQCFEDLFVEKHHTVLRARHTAQEVAATWLLYSEQNLLRRTIVAWKIGSLASRSERKRQWQEMKRRVEDGNSAVLDKEEAIRAKAAEVLFCSSVQQVLPLIVKRWRRLALKERRSREVELLRQRSQARLQEQQYRLEQAQLAAVRYRNHAFASCFVTSAVGSANWLRIFLWDWRRAVTSSTSIKILRLWYVVAAMKIFKCEHWLLEFCLRLWSAIVQIPLMKKAQSQLQPILVLHEEASIEARLVSGESFLLQYIVICAWRRFLRAELLKLEVKHVCRQWNSEEEQVARTLHRVRSRISLIWSWSDLSIRRLHAREDLCDAMLAWAQETRCFGEEARLRQELQEAQTGPKVQHRFEDIVCARWRDRSLRLHEREHQSSCLASSFFCWRTAALREGVTRRRLRSGERALTVVEQWMGSWRLQVQRLVFDNWQTVLCSARQRWIERRRRWLEKMLEEDLRGQATPSSLPKQQDHVLQEAFLGSPATPSSLPKQQDHVLQEAFLGSPATPSSLPKQQDHVLQEAFLGSPADGSSPSHLIDVDFAAKLQRFTFGLKVESLQHRLHLPD